MIFESRKGRYIQQESENEGVFLLSGDFLKFRTKVSLLENEPEV